MEQWWPVIEWFQEWGRTIGWTIAACGLAKGIYGLYRERRCNP